MIELFTTSKCPRCEKIVAFLDGAKIEYTKRVIDQDPEAETDAIMLGIHSAPALKIDETVFITREIFTKEDDILSNVKELLASTKPVEQVAQSNNDDNRCRYYATCLLLKMPYWCEDWSKSSACEEYQRRMNIEENVAYQQKQKAKKKKVNEKNGV